MKNNLHRIIKHPLFWAFITMLLLIFGSRQLFAGKDNVPILAAVVTGSVVMFGYFATHYLTMARELKKKKFNQCLELIKKFGFLF
jgi:hypothetical protein